MSRLVLAALVVSLAATVAVAASGTDAVQFEVPWKGLVVLSIVGAVWIADRRRRAQRR